MNKICDNSYFDKLLLKKSIELIKKVEFWQNFFLKYKIKVHIDPNEMENETIPKQIAINLVGGCSLGYNSSYICDKEGMHYNYYPNDIFFCWGQHGLGNFKRKINNKTAISINHLLISGYPYSYFSEKKKEETQAIKKKLQKNGAKFIILFLDEGAGDNKDYHDQLFPNEKLKTCYKFLFNWLIKDNEVGLIVKTKRIIRLKNLSNIDHLLEKAENTGRCHVVKDEVGAMPWHYFEISDVAVAAACDTIPSSVLDCVINNNKKRAIFFDFPQLKNSEPELYSWGENKVVFKDMEKMMLSLSSFKSNMKSNSDFGSWRKDYIENIDSFGDRKCGYRIGSYISCLLKNFDDGLDTNKAIEIANKNYQLFANE